MIFAENLTADERDKLAARIMSEITPQKRSGRPSGTARALVKEYCEPPESCFSCPFADCVAGSGTKGFGKRSDKEFEYLKNAVNITDKHKEVST